MGRTGSRTPPSTSLKTLPIDADKDWGGKSITNVGNLSATKIYVGDIILKYGWRVFEMPEALYLEKGGRRFKIKIEEVV